MTARHFQIAIAATFLMFGGVALFMPEIVIKASFTSSYQENTFVVRFVIACFGAQAVLFGLMALVTRWSARSFAVFGVLLLPFFVFDFWFHYRVPVLTATGMLDFAGNMFMLVFALLGWRAARAEERA